MTTQLPPPAGTQPYPPGYPPPQPPGKPHRAWPRRQKILTALMAAFALVVVIVAANAAGGGSKKSAASSPKAVAPAGTAAPTRAPDATLSAGETKFVAAIRSGFGHPGYSNSATDAQIASVATQVC
jgi:hypothetical protein